MASVTPQTSQMRPFEKIAALAGGAVVFTVVAYGTRRLLERLFGPTVEPERVVIVVRGDQSIEVLPSDQTVVVDDDDDKEEEA